MLDVGHLWIISGLVDCECLVGRAKLVRWVPSQRLSGIQKVTVNRGLPANLPTACLVLTPTSLEFEIFHWFNPFLPEITTLISG